jgi:hypothetical protein
VDGGNKKASRLAPTTGLATDHCAPTLLSKNIVDLSSKSVKLLTIGFINFFRGRRRRRGAVGVWINF